MNPRTEAALALAVGVAAFLLYTGGGAIINPADISWLMHGDPASSYLGWQFFRDTPLRQWPLGANPGYGMDLGSSIVFSDSIPALALLLKPFSRWLPQVFQYFGLWLAACFMLQAWFGWKLARLCTTDRWTALAGGALFAIAPAMCLRLFGHYALAGHWLLLAGLYLYLRPTRSLRAWTLLLAVAALVHAYLLLMALGLFGADLLRRAWSRERKISTSIAGLVGIMGMVVLLMVAAGYFMLGGTGDIAVGNDAFSTYRMNLQAPIDPNELWSRSLPDLPGGPGEYEGFAFLGSGMLLLVLASTGLIARARITSIRNQDIAVAPERASPKLALLVPMLLVSAFFVAIAVSNHVALGTREVLDYELPRFLTSFTSVFRGSGRFVWPVYYLTYFLVFRAITAHLGAPQARLLLLVALGLQVVDSSPSWRHFAGVTSGAPTWTPPMQSRHWQELAGSYSRIRILPPRNLPDEWVALGEFASRQGMATQAGSFARIGAVREAEARLRAYQAVVDGPLDPDALYIIQDDDVWRYLLSAPTYSGNVGMLDGFRILAPGGCTGCVPAPPSASAAPAPARRKPVAPRLLAGWTGPTADQGRWSEGNSAYAAVDVPEGASGDLALEMDATALVSMRHPLQRIRVSVNGRHLAEIWYVFQRGRGLIRLPVPRSLVQGPVLMVRFDCPDATSPTAAGINEDPRQLALWLVTLRAVPSG